MQFNGNAVGRFIVRKFVRLAWTTTQQKCTTIGALVGFAFSMLLPGFGLASAGSGIAGWVIAVPLLTVLFGLAGNRVGIGREKAALVRKVQAKPHASEE